MRKASLRFVLFTAAAGGCAGGPAEPLTTDHPAHPDAPAAPASARSSTLSIGPDAAPVAATRNAPEEDHSQHQGHEHGGHEHGGHE